MKCPAGYTEHTWVYYHSRGVRWCHDCHNEEKLWADFGLVKKGTEHEQDPEHRPDGQRASAPAAGQGS